MFRQSLLAWSTWCALSLPLAVAQLRNEDLAPLLEGFAKRPQDEIRLDRRVPLSTNDPTVAPLVDLQVFAPPVVPAHGTSCVVELIEHSFGDGSYNNPAIVKYVPPVLTACGPIGKWASISLNLTVSSIGTQYDRLGEIYLGHTEIWRTSSAEPTKTGTIWTTLKDVTHYTPLFAAPADLMMDFSNIIAPELLLDGALNVTLTAKFFAPTQSFPTPRTSDQIIPLSNLSPSTANFFTISDDVGAVSNITLPPTTVEAYVEIFCSGNGNEEFWYSNTPDEFLGMFPASTGLIGKGPFREVQLLVDDQLAGVVWPYAVIYTGGITPSNWRPLTAYGTYDAPTYWLDITAFLPVLLNTAKTHTVTLRVVGQGSNPSINSNWYVSGSIHLRKGTRRTTGTINTYRPGSLDVKTMGGVKGGAVWTQVQASRMFFVETVLQTAGGPKVVTASQSLRYENEAKYVDDGWIQWVNQSTEGTTLSTHDGIEVLRDSFSYPLSVFSNYSLYTAEFGGYGSEIHQTYSRALQPPTSVLRTIQSIQHAKGEIGMDNWPGLRHAINGTAATEQTFGYIDGRKETYFRDVATNNDGWVKDEVWGSLRDANPPVPDNQIFHNGIGPGFRRSVPGRRAKRNNNL